MSFCFLHIKSHDLFDEVAVGHNAPYVCLGEFQSDRLEAEFGIYRQMSGGNYYRAYISVEQVLCSLQLQRLKLFDRLEIILETSSKEAECCRSDLTESELDILDNSIVSSQTLSCEVLATLYYGCGSR